MFRSEALDSRQNMKKESKCWLLVAPDYIFCLLALLAEESSAGYKHMSKLAWHEVHGTMNTRGLWSRTFSCTFSTLHECLLLLLFAEPIKSSLCMSASHQEVEL